MMIERLVEEERAAEGVAPIGCARLGDQRSVTYTLKQGALSTR